MSHWPLRREDITRPAYRSLAQGIAAAIDAGSLRPGQRLPPHRDLAWQLGVSVQTVSRAYEELIRADLISGQVGRGSFIKSGPRESIEVPWFRAPTDRPPVDLSMMTPVHLPQIAEAWADSMTRLAHKLPQSAMLSFRPRQTMSLYGGMAAGWLSRCGITVPAQRILITNGTTPAMFVALMTVAQPGDWIATESVTCHTIKPSAQHLHLRLKGIECDERGMIPEALIREAARSGGRMRAVFLLPSGGGPQARIVDRDRREALAQAAATAGLVILESDPTGPMPPRRPPAISSFAPERSFYFTGLSKCLSPGLRLGFLTLPEKWAEAALNRHLSMAWMATPLMAEIAQDWIADGTADRLLDAQRVELAARNRMALRVLGTDAQGFLHGLHRWLPLPEGTDEPAVVARALDRQVAIAPGAGFAVLPSGPAIRVSLGGVQTSDLDQALRSLSAILRG
ncbi:PLP-dependent aminotransferase family protein [Paracoccus sp. 1_MG-2023]|uniref:MocR-like ectoine utilization transcription factor EhuR n=1 Tax=unclassified Paracoccus (in: a-proteobacteria) TaxID=2688777 RepID=UPI001C09E07B|nr:MULTISPECIES: PLP-dependent aminotransferase family protein [unclassified Paracoccus (in: a-proteobacteria)]MBU2958607.1 PLP-dependent aminotransferase family protein [Paracoccus sp. C2R09]MDO6667600.1 PLP-dependent aminotransferase family protein [Paracoccus sp. 1_MG-2023]